MSGRKSGPKDYVIWFLAVPISQVILFSGVIILLGAHLIEALRLLHFFRWREVS